MVVLTYSPVTWDGEQEAHESWLYKPLSLTRKGWGQLNAS